MAQTPLVDIHTKAQSLIRGLSDSEQQILSLWISLQKLEEYDEGHRKGKAEGFRDAHQSSFLFGGVLGGSLAVFFLVLHFYPWPFSAPDCSLPLEEAQRACDAEVAFIKQRQDFHFDWLPNGGIELDRSDSMPGYVCYRNADTIFCVPQEDSP